MVAPEERRRVEDRGGERKRAALVSGAGPWGLASERVEGFGGTKSPELIFDN
jgi:hypothetical protein